MARPAIEPRMRKMMRSRMGMDEPAADNPVAEDGAPPMEEAPAEESGNEGPSIFASKEAMGGKQWKEGDEVVFKIKAIDPETGEAELYYAPEKPSDGKPADSMEAMDAAMPEGQGPPPTGGY